jgi:MFS family permease
VLGENSGALKRARLAVISAFIINGFVMGTFVSRIPDIKIALNLTNADIGYSLLFISAGVFLSLRPAGKLTAYFGSRLVTNSSYFLMVGAIFLLANVTTVWTFRLALFLFGWVNATHDVAMNAHGVYVEQAMKRRTMGFFHACWSIGTLLGGLLGGLFSQNEVSFTSQELIVSLIISLVATVFRTFFLSTEVDRVRKEKTNTTLSESGKKSHGRTLWIFGFFGLCAALSEGAAGDWGGVLARETFNGTPFLSTLPYIVFTFTMVVGRISGDYFATHFGVGRSIRWGGFLAGTGLLVGLVIGGIPAIVFAWFCLGLGLSVTIPLIFSSAGELATTTYKGEISPAEAIAHVSGTSYFGFVVGPPLIGLLSDFLTLRWALLLLVLLTLFLTRAARFVKSV